MQRLILLLLALFASLCVGCGSGKTGAMEACGATPEFAYSEDVARDLDQRLMPYLQGTTGEFTLQTTSQGLTSWLAYTARQWPALPLRDAVMWFTTERIHFSGTVTRILPFSVSVQLHARVWLDGETPQLAVEEACLGSSPLPVWLRRLAERIVNETIVDTGSYVRLDVLVLGEGEIYALGRIGP